MLNLNIKVGESVLINDSLTLTIAEATDGGVSIQLDSDGPITASDAEPASPGKDNAKLPSTLSATKSPARGWAN